MKSPRKLSFILITLVALAVVSAGGWLLRSDAPMWEADREAAALPQAGDAFPQSQATAPTRTPTPDPSGEPLGADAPEPAGSDTRVARGAGSDPRDDGETSLDEANAATVESRLTEAIERARRERGVPISPGLVAQVIAEGQVRVIVTQPSSQPRLEPRLAGTRHEPARYYTHIPFAAIEVGPQALLDLVESQDVLGIEADRRHRPSLMDTVPIISADLAQGAGWDGSGRVVAIIDTGVDTSHPAFAGRVVDEACFSADGDCPGGGTVELGPGTGVPCPFDCGHGTLVAGVALGLDPGGIDTGVAPDAGLVSIQVFSNDGGEPAAWTSDIIAGLDHVFSLRFAYDFAAVNMSLGGDPFNSTAACDAANVARKASIDLLRAAGIATVASSGNDGFTDLISEPACISTAISVGSTNKSDGISTFSNSSSCLHLLAPGDGVTTPAAGGGFAIASGTSFSTPHVSGAWAAMLEAVPGSSVGEVLTALRATGQSVSDPRNAVSTPRINVNSAIAELAGGVVVAAIPTCDGPSQVVPEPELPADACGLVGLEVLAAWALVSFGSRRRRASK